MPNVRFEHNLFQSSDIEKFADAVDEICKRNGILVDEHARSIQVDAYYLNGKFIPRGDERARLYVSIGIVDTLSPGRNTEDDRIKRWEIAGEINDAATRILGVKTDNVAVEFDIRSPGNNFFRGKGPRPTAPTTAG